MLKEILSKENLSFFLIFWEGLLSFFSPCVIPLIPVYIGYLAGNAKHTDENGLITYQRKKVFFHTVFFILGISAAFFLLGIAFTALGSFFKSNQLFFTRIGGVIIIALGLIQIGLLDFKFLQRERKLNVNFGNREMNPLIAFLLGFTFSFAWTPCVGPALSTVLIMASGSGSTLSASLLILLYTLGFVIPFLLLGLFTVQVLNFLKKHQNLLKYTVKAGGVLLILIGIMTFTGWMNGISHYLNSFNPPNSSEAASGSNENNNDNKNSSETVLTENNGGLSNPSGTAAPIGTAGDSAAQETDGNSGSDSSKTASGDVIPAFDFTLTDQYGSKHTLSDYKGKVVFLNFWATWCGPCQNELPEIEDIYQEFGKNEGDVIILGVTNPASKEYPDNADVSKEEVKAFLDENGYTFPVLYDETGDVLKDYSISAFPTTFMIDKKGNIYGYAPGQLTKDIMRNIIQKTLDSSN